MLQYLLISLYILPFITADTPANCTYGDAIGTWQLFSGDFALNCNSAKLLPKSTIRLIYPNLAEDPFGNIGTWTLIYNQGFEVVINNFKYFGFFDYKKINSTYSISLCDRLQPNWYHDVLIRQWKCFNALKSKSVEGKEQVSPTPNASLLTAIRYGSQQNIVSRINDMNIGWKAHDYTFLHNKTLNDIINMAGGSNNKLARPKTAPITQEIEQSAQVLPKSFDWRNVNGVNYVSPVRNQGQCGSCFAFASAGLLEARFRIRSNNRVAPILSTQDVVECCPYSQGCDGGFPYLVAGKYAEDFGMSAESCNPYKGINGPCSTKKNCTKYYATKYRYIGGFYGGSNEPLMRLELVRNGPVAVGFEVYPDFMSYKTGVYHHNFNLNGLSELKFGFNPFELTNHAVLVVGYGETTAKEKYWIVKNSWSTSWGEGGFFKIRRGSDECGIESLGVATEPIL